MQMGRMIKQRGCYTAPFATNGSPAWTLHELIGRAQDEHSSARVGVARIVSRLEDVTPTSVSIGRVLIEQIPDGESEPQVLLHRIRPIQVKYAVVAHVVRRIRRSVSSQIRVATLVLLDERQVPRREPPIERQVVPPPRNDAAGAVIDRRHHAVDAAERLIKEALQLILVEVRALQPEGEGTPLARRHAIADGRV